MRSRLTFLSLALALLALPALAADTRPALTYGGFKGTLTGTVGEVGPKGLAFDLKVSKATAAADSPTTDTSLLVGKQVQINTQWQKGGNGKWQPVPAQVTFVKGLKTGQELTISVVNDEGKRLHIVEVPK